MPTRGARITSAVLVASTDSGNANGDFCKILGQIDPVDATAPAINFEVNLPAAWNGRMVRIGGGDFDEVLVTGLDPLDFDPATLATPLARGYMTFGDDSGHVSGLTNAASPTTTRRWPTTGGKR